MDRRDLITEQPNPNSSSIDIMSTREILEEINKEDAKISFAIKSAIPQIEKTVELCVDAIKHIKFPEIVEHPEICICSVFPPRTVCGDSSSRKKIPSYYLIILAGLITVIAGTAYRLL